MTILKTAARETRGIYEHPKKSLHSHLRAIMALDDSR